MKVRTCLTLTLSGCGLLACLLMVPAEACCPAGGKGKPVVNADQTVIILWDAANSMQHFIRRASFKTDSDDFGFIIPSPSQPELGESGNEAFPYILKLTEPEKIHRSSNLGCGCGAGKSDKKPAAAHSVKVLEEKIVAGFKAAVLETSSSEDLVKWLNGNGYFFSPEVQAWAKPYVEKGWKFTALKVARDADGKDKKKDLTASALRLSFKTKEPLFPYREPDSKSAAEPLGAKSRLLRIYFLAEARYQGELTKEVPWTGKAVWAGKIKAEDRKKILEHLKLPEGTGPAEWYLTEFEDNWPYRVAPADVVFARCAEQNNLRREPIVVGSSPYPTDVTAYAIAVVVLGPALVRWSRRGKQS